MKKAGDRMENKKISKGYIWLSIVMIVSLALNFTGFMKNEKTVLAANNHRPMGNASVSVQNQTLHLEGYTFDPDCTSYAAAVHVYIFQDASNKICIKTFIADSYHSQADRDHHCGYYHGFRQDVTVDRTGTWNLEVYAIDLNSDGSTAGIYNPIIYSGTVTFTQEPSLSVGTNALTFTSDGTLSPYSMGVDTNNTGSYHVYSDSSWLRVGRNRNKGSSGTNLLSVSAGYFYIFADQNTSQYGRTGTLTISHAMDSSKKQIITVTQTAPAPQLTLFPVNMAADSDGMISPSYVNIDTGNTGGYTVSSNNSWLRVNTNNDRNSSVEKLVSKTSGYLYVFAEKNTNTDTRTGTITISHTSDKNKEQIVTITQKGSILVPQLTAVPTSITADSDGILSQAYINVDTDGTGNYNVSSSDSWLTAGTENYKNSSKTNLSLVENGTLYIFVSENTTESGRTGTLTISHSLNNNQQQKITVTQDGKKKKAVLQANQSEISIQADGTVSPSHMIKVSTNTTGGFRVSSSQSWLKISKENSNRSLEGTLLYMDSGSFYIFPEKNTMENIRNGVITVEHDKDPEKKIEIKVVQEGQKKEDIDSPYLSVNQTELNVAADGGFTDGNCCILVNTNNTGGFQVTSTVNWLKISKDNTAGTEKTLRYTDSGNIYLFAEKNTSEKRRDAVITIIHDKDKNLNKSVIITQEPLEESPSSAVLSVSRDMVNANVNGETDVQYIEVKAGNTNGFSVETDTAWIQIAKTGDGSRTSKLSFQENEDSKFYIFVNKTEDNTEREGKIVISGNSGNVSATVFVRQAELIPVLNASSVVISIERDGSFSGENEIFIDTEDTGGFTAVIKDASWLRLTSNKEAGFSEGFATRVYDGSASLYLTAKENDTGGIRTGQILLEHATGGKTITINVSQSGAADKNDRPFFVDTETHDFDRFERGISSAVNITADSEINWTVTSNDSTWLKVSKNNSLSGNAYGSVSGSGNAVFYIIVEKNETYEERGEWIKVTAPERESYEIYVTQQGKEGIPLETVINQIKFSTSKKTFRKNKTSKIKIQYPNLPKLDIEEVDVKNCVEFIKYKSNRPKIVSVNKNGVIKGKKNGKGKISVRIKLSDDMGNEIERTVTVKVIVGRAKVNIKAFQD